MLSLFIGMVLTISILLKTNLLPLNRPDTAALPKSGSICYATGQVYKRDSSYVYIKNVSLWNNSKTLVYQGNAGLRIDGVPENNAQIGGKLYISGNFKGFNTATNPGEFDPAAYYMDQNLLGSVENSRIISAQHRYNIFLEALASTKEAFADKLSYIYPEKEASILRDILLGDKSSLNPEIKQLYQDNGIAHILSISSLHITILGMSLYLALRKAGCMPYIAAPIGGLSLCLYGIMTGFSVSAIRAIVTYLLLLLSKVLKRTTDSLTSLSITGIILLVINPTYLRNSGFLLSFTALLGILIIFPILDKIFSPGTNILKYTSPTSLKYHVQRYSKRILMKLRQSLLVSISISISTLPAQLFFFYQVPTFSPLLNLLVLPLMSTLLICGLLSMTTPFAAPFKAVTIFILGYYERLCRGFIRLPFRQWNPGKPTPIMMVAYSLIWISFLVISHNYLLKTSHKPESKNHKELIFNPQKHHFRLSLYFFTSLLICFGLLSLPKLPKDTVLFLDVGQGDCCIMYTSGRQVYLFDGGSSTKSSVGKYILKPALKSLGLSHINAIFVSHPDGDHISGITELLEYRDEWGLGIDGVYLPGCTIPDSPNLNTLYTASLSGKNKRAVPVRYLTLGDSWRSGNTLFTCLHPDIGFLSEDINALSQCIYIQSSTGTSLLITGDVEGPGERALCQQLSSLEINHLDYLKVAHHGSGYSTTDVFLNQLNPEICIISCGLNNKYGHPHPQTLNRLDNHNCQILRTDLRGCIIIRIGAKSQLPAHRIFFRFLYPHLSEYTD